MTTIVRAHGGWDGTTWTFVPDGVTVKFYTDEDMNLYTSQAIAVLAQAGFDNYNEAYGPGTTDGDNPVGCPNYQLTPRSSGEMQRDLSAYAEGARIVFVGDGIKGPIFMCEGTEDTCKAGVHSCTGVFGQIADPDLIYMACRGVEGTDPGVTRGIGPSDGRDTDTYDETIAWHDWFSKTKDSDPGAVADDFASRPQEFQAQMLAWPDIRNWVFVREARAFATDDPIAFYRQVAGMIRDKNRLGVGDDETLAAISTAPDLVAIYQEGARQANATDQWRQDAENTWAPSDEDLDAIASVNQANMKSASDGDSVAYVTAGFIALIGDGHNEAYVDWAAAQQDVARGGIRVTKGGLFRGAGALEVAGCPPAKQGVVQAALERFSDKTITFE